LGISVQSLRNARCTRRGALQGLPYHKVGRRVLYSLQDVWDFLAAHRVTINRHQAPREE